MFACGCSLWLTVVWIFAMIYDKWSSLVQIIQVSGQISWLVAKLVLTMRNWEEELGLTGLFKTSRKPLLSLPWGRFTINRLTRIAKFTFRKLHWKFKQQPIELSIIHVDMIKNQILCIELWPSKLDVKCQLPVGGTFSDQIVILQLSVSFPWRIPWFQTGKIDHGEFLVLKLKSLVTW